MNPTEITLERVYFVVCAVVAVAGAIGTVASLNPIRAALSLLFSIVAIAGVFLQLHAPFLAAIQLIVYAGAVVVLFIFVIMLIGPSATAPRDSRGRVTRIVSGIAMSAITVQIILVVHRKWMRVPTAQAGFGTVEAFGELLFGEYLVPFEIASVLLLVAIVGAMAVGRGKQPDPQLAKAAKGAEAPDERPAREAADGGYAEFETRGAIATKGADKGANKGAGG